MSVEPVVRCPQCGKYYCPNCSQAAHIHRQVDPKTLADTATLVKGERHGLKDAKELGITDETITSVREKLKPYQKEETK